MKPVWFVAGRAMVLLFVSMLVAVSAEARDAIFVEIPDIEGDIRNAVCDRDCFKVLSAGFGLEREDSTHIGGGGKGGSLVFEELVLTKRGGVASSQLFLLAASGRDVPELKVRFATTVQGKLEVYAEIELFEALAASYRVQSDSRARPVETIAFDYRVMCLRTRDPSAKGGFPGPWEEACYNRVTKKK